MSNKTYTFSEAALKRCVTRIQETAQEEVSLSYRNIVDAIKPENPGRMSSAVESVLTYMARENKKGLILVVIALCGEIQDLREAVGEYFNARAKLHDMASERWPSEVKTPWTED